MKKTAILIFACDRYELLFEGFDYFFDKYWGDKNPLKKYFSVEANNLKLVKLHSSGVYKTEHTGVNFGDYALAEVIKNESQFLMSHQVSIWNKDFLYEQLKDNEHPWRNERRGTKRLKKSDQKIYQIDLLSENGNVPINDNSSKIEPGEYHTISVNACIHPKAKKFISELQKNNPQYSDKIGT